MILIPLLALLAQPSSDTDPFGLRAWSACLIDKRDFYVASDEPAETVATAILGACAEFEQQAHTKTLARVPQSRGAVYAREWTDREIALTKASYREQLISYIIQKRLEGM